MGLELRVSELSAGYPGQIVLDGVAFRVGAGQVLGLIGPNGAGKSTLLRTLARALPVASGIVRLDDRPLQDWDRQTLARTMAVMATQEVPQSPGLTVRAYVGLGRTPHQDRWGGGTAQDRAAIERALTQVGIIPLADRPFHSISAGERQRAQLARALTQGPQLLLLDEPTSHLDIGRQQSLLGLLREVAASGVAVVAALHDLNLAAAACDQLLLLQNGRAVAVGPPGDVLTPARLETAYGHPWLIRPHPQSGRPWVFPAEPQPLGGQAPLLHLIGGGASLPAIAGPLQRLGYRLQAGILHAGDSDVQLTADLGIPSLLAPAFTPIDGPLGRELAEWLERADGVVIGDVPFGPGNVGNLETLVASQQRRTPTALPIWSLATRPWAERDFAGGSVVQLAQALHYDSPNAVPELLARLSLFREASCPQP